MKAEIRLNHNGIGSVSIDDNDLSNVVSNLALFAKANGGVRLTLGLMAPRNLHFTGDVEVTLPEAVEKLLLGMGWTPPVPAPPTSHVGGGAAPSPTG